MWISGFMCVFFYQKLNTQSVKKFQKDFEEMFTVISIIFQKQCE